MKNYRFLKIEQDEETELYSIYGILDNVENQWVVTASLIAEEIQQDDLYMYVGDKIADRVIMQGFETFDDAPMQVTIPSNFPFPEGTTSAQNNLIDAQISYLTELIEKPAGLSTEQISNINDVLDFIEVAYKRNNPDGDRQHEYYDAIVKGESKCLDFKDAMFFLHQPIKKYLLS